MAVVRKGSKVNLITGYDEGEDTSQNYGKTRWLAQTFTLDALYAVWRCRFKSFTSIGDRFYDYALRATDAAGKPTGPDLETTSLSPTGEKFWSPGRWRRFDFGGFPQLPAGTYALIASVPDAPASDTYHLRSNSTVPTYAGGKAWYSNNSGVTWNEILNTDLMFEVWGYQPPPDPPPPDAPKNWAPMNLLLDDEIGAMEIVVTTDILVHLFMRWTLEKPLKHPLERFRRGIRLMDDTRYCFVAWEENEQIEKGDTFTHTFIKPGWAICETRYFYFIGTKCAEESPSASPIFYFHRGGVEMYVINLGKLGEAQTLHGEVKLKEGANVTLTRDDLNNAIEIAAAGAAFEGFGNSWLKHDPSGQLAASLHFKFDEVSFNITGAGIDCRLYTEPMRNWGFRRPCSCEIKLAKGASAGGNPSVYAAIVYTTADIRSNMNQDCVGWMTGPNGAVSCFNGNNTGFKRTNFAWGNWPPVWLKWILSATDIKFYANGTLVATHTTYLPASQNDCFFALQGFGSSPFSEPVYMTRPHYSAD